ncbi:hypothetical protein Tco_0145863, partial [Tanacetum coccineum]
EMAPSGSNALLFDVHYDGIFMFAPLRYENGVVYELRVTKDKKYDYDGLKIVECDSDLEAMYEFADAYGIIQMYLAHIPQNLAEYYFKKNFFDESGDEAICKLRIHENRKKDAGNMDSLTPKKNDTGVCGSGTNVEFSYKQSNAPDATLDVDEFDYGDTGASFESVDDQTGAPSQADNGKGKMIEEDNIVNKVVDKGKGLMIEEERPVPARKAMGRNKGIVIEENDNPNVMDSDSSDSEVERDQIPDYSMLYSDSESEYSDRSVDYLSEGEDELIQLRKRNSEAKRAKVSQAGAILSGNIPTHHPDATENEETTKLEEKFVVVAQQRMLDLQRTLSNHTVKGWNSSKINKVPPSVPIPPVEEHLGSSQYELDGSSSTVIASRRRKENRGLILKSRKSTCKSATYSKLTNQHKMMYAVDNPTVLSNRSNTKDQNQEQGGTLSFQGREEGVKESLKKACKGSPRH